MVRFLGPTGAAIARRIPSLCAGTIDASPRQDSNFVCWYRSLYRRLDSDRSQRRDFWIAGARTKSRAVGCFHLDNFYAHIKICFESGRESCRDGRRHFAARDFV